jgi:hypothetical protein
MFQFAAAAFIQPARKPIRGSGRGVVDLVCAAALTHGTAIKEKASNNLDFTERSV